MKSSQLKEDAEGDAIIDVQVESKNEIFSKFNYEEGDILTTEFTDYLWNKAKLVPTNKNLHIKVYANEELNVNKVENAIKKHYKNEYIEVKSELSYLGRFSLINLILGIITLAVLLVLHNVFDNYFLVSIVDILAWVFVWEAFDSFFLERARLKRRQKHILKIYSSEVEIILEK